MLNVQDAGLFMYSFLPILAFEVVCLFQNSSETFDRVPGENFLGGGGAPNDSENLKDSLRLST